MLHAPIVLYYSSAKPESGYSGAVKGYAQKLAHALGYEAVQADSPEPRSHPLPEISIGLQEAAWPAKRPLYELKARPYADQHGAGPSMHPLSAHMLADAPCPWPAEKKLGGVCVANPHWLASDSDAWAKRLLRWANCNQLEVLMVTNSPRTNALSWQMFKDALGAQADIPIYFNEAQSEENAYLSILAHASLLLILGSSRSMAGEAAMSRAPIVYVADTPEQYAAFAKEAPAARYQVLSHSQPVRQMHCEPLDVTQAYVQETIASLRIEKVA